MKGGLKQQQWIWSSIERKCLHLLQQPKNTKSTILQIQAFMLRNSLDTNLNLLTKFITTCSSIVTLSPPFSGIKHTRRVFNHAPNTKIEDVFFCNSMIKAHVGNRQFSESYTLFRDMRKSVEFSPDNFVLSCLAKACCLDMKVTEGKQLHGYVLKVGFCVDLYVSTALLDMYAKFGKMGYARKLFDAMSERSIVSWTALVSGYARFGDMGNARKLFDLMPEKDVAAFNMMIDAFVKFGDMGSARSLFDEMVVKNVVSWTSMIHGYCNNGGVDIARSLFNVMPEKNLFSWNAMIGGYSQNKQPREALKLFHEMQSNTCLEPDSVTIVSILPAIADLGALELGGWVHRFALKKNIDRKTNICTALVDMYAKCGEISKARKLFDEMSEKETPSWNAMINGLAVNGYGKEALEMFSKMKCSGFKPTDITMIGVLTACNHNGLVEEGKKWFQEMKEFDLDPQMEHYGCMVDLLGKAGCLEEVEMLIENMPFEANGIILSSFLHACGKFNDVTRAEKVLNKVVKMDPQNYGNYVMLRNMYATEGRWRGGEDIIGLMRKNTANKEVGCSIIEINNRVWEFIAGNRLHPQRDVINSVLQILLTHMKRQEA